MEFIKFISFQVIFKTRDNEDELQLDEHIIKPGFIRIRVFSRFRAAKRHQIFISFKVNDDVEIAESDEIKLINGYYCTCQTGARTLGTCAHVASILWFLGYARHHENIRYPNSSLLDTTLDEAERPQHQINPDDEVIDV